MTINKSIKKIKLDIERIAITILKVETLNPRNLDKLDFYNLHIVSIRHALEEAYTMGVKDGEERNKEN